MFKFVKNSKALTFFVLQIIAIQCIYAHKGTYSGRLNEKLPTPIFLGFDYRYGFTLNHSPALQALNTHHFSTYEISLFRQTIGNDYWEQKCTYPAYGISFMYSELGSSEYLGRAFGLYPFLDIHLFRWKQNNAFTFTFGLGLAYGTKPYDRFNNYKNTAYGSHLNALIHLGFKGDIHLFHGLYFSGGFDFTHISNGTTKEPNYGLNNASLFLGLSYQLNDVSCEKKVWEEEPRKKYPYRFQIAGYANCKDIDYLDETSPYFTGGLNFNLLKRYRFARSWGVGIELDLDMAAVQILKNKNEFSGNVISYMIPGLKAIHQFHIHRFCIGTELCYMLYYKDKSNNGLYVNLTAGYDITDWLMAGLSLRAGFFDADYIGFGLGFKVWDVK